MRKSVKNSVSSLALAAMLSSGVIGIDAASARNKSDKIKDDSPLASARNKSDVIKPNPDPAVAKKNKSSWIFPTVAALAAAVGLIIATQNDNPTSP